MTLLQIISISLAALAAGIVDAVAGGGGLITIPSLMLAGLPPQTVLGTNKLAMSSGTGVATFNFWRNGKINWKIVASGLVFTLGGAVIGSRLVLFLPQAIAAKVMVGLLPLGMVAVFMKKSALHHDRPLMRPDYLFKIPVICFLLGTYDGFFGPGTGTFIVMAFHMVLHRDLIESTANAKVFNFVSNIAALVVFILHRNVLYLVAIPMGIMAMLGNYIGSHLAISKGQHFIRRMLLGVLALLMLTLVVKFLIF